MNLKFDQFLLSSDLSVYNLPILLLKRAWRSRPEKYFHRFSKWIRWPWNLPSTLTGHCCSPLSLSICFSEVTWLLTATNYSNWRHGHFSKCHINCIIYRKYTLITHYAFFVTYLHLAKNYFSHQTAHKILWCFVKIHLNIE